MDLAKLDKDSLAMAGGAALSLAFSYIPGLSDRYAALTPITKRLVMAALLLVLTLAYFAAGCFQLLPEGYVQCDAQGALTIGRVWMYALVANQSMYAISPRTNQQTQATPPADGAKG